MIKQTFLAAFLCLVAWTTTADAAFIEVRSNNFYLTTGGTGTGRAQGIHADQTFSISSVGIFGNLVQQSFDLLIYSSADGISPGGVVASNSATAGGTGNGWNDIALNFTFNAGNYYIVNWRATNGNSSWATTLDYYNDNGLPVTVGPITLVEGIEGFNATSSGNFLHPNFRYNTGTASVPGPGALTLLGLGFLGLGLRRRA